MALTTLGYPYPVGTDKVVDGDNVLNALAVATDDHHGVWDRGALTIAIAAIDTNYSSAVTFRAGLFSDVPTALQVQAQTQVPHQAWATGATPTATGFTCYARRSSGTGNLVIHWVAVQI